MQTAKVLDPAEAAERAVKITNAYWNVACKKWGIKGRQPPPIQFNLKGKVAGQANAFGHYKTSPIYSVRYNLAKLIENPQYFYKHTIPHEVAHIIGWFISGNMAHDSAWLNVMRSLGIEMAAKKYGVDRNGRMVDPRTQKDLP